LDAVFTIDVEEDLSILLEIILVPLEKVWLVLRIWWDRLLRIGRKIIIQLIRLNHVRYAWIILWIWGQNVDIFTMRCVCGSGWVKKQEVVRYAREECLQMFMFTALDVSIIPS